MSDLVGAGGGVETLTAVAVVTEKMVVVTGEGMSLALFREISAAMLELRATSLGLRVLEVVAETGAMKVLNVVTVESVLVIDEDSVPDCVVVEVTVTIDGVDVDGVIVIITTCVEVVGGVCVTKIVVVKGETVVVSSERVAIDVCETSLANVGANDEVVVTLSLWLLCLFM